jgi:hypothetical protein
MRQLDGKGVKTRRAVNMRRRKRSAGDPTKLSLGLGLRHCPKPRAAGERGTACCRRFARCLAIFWRGIGKRARTCGTSLRREYGSSASGLPPYAGCRGAAPTSPLMTRARAERDREIGLWRAALPSMQCPRRASEIRSGFGTWFVSLLPRTRTFALAGSFHPSARIGSWGPARRQSGRR